MPGQNIPLFDPEESVMVRFRLPQHILIKIKKIAEQDESNVTEALIKCVLTEHTLRKRYQSGDRFVIYNTKGKRIADFVPLRNQDPIEVIPRYSNWFKKLLTCLSGGR